MVVSVKRKSLRAHKVYIYMFDHHQKIVDLAMSVRLSVRFYECLNSLDSPSARAIRVCYR